MINIGEVVRGSWPWGPMATTMRGLRGLRGADEGGGFVGVVGGYGEDAEFDDV